ncbi:hypothetical protein ABIC99_002298 [Sphaerotilus sulfidivorans]|uniref:Uncharacterized protein n=1 Tax=Sphaerotilus sulfidivorans TaxID=639200 RepID=A0ABV2ING1_9BURK
MPTQATLDAVLPGGQLVAEPPQHEHRKPSTEQ